MANISYYGSQFLSKLLYKFLTIFHTTKSFDDQYHQDNFFTVYISYAFLQFFMYSSLIVITNYNIFHLSQTWSTVPCILHSILDLVCCTMQSSSHPSLGLQYHAFFAQSQSWSIVQRTCNMHSAPLTKLSLQTAWYSILYRAFFTILDIFYCTVHSSYHPSLSLLVHAFFIPSQPWSAVKCACNMHSAPHPKLNLLYHAFFTILDI